MNPIFTVRDGPHDKPNGYYKAHMLRRADMTGFFMMQEVGGQKRKFPAHQNDIRIYWEDNPHVESNPDPVRSIEVQGAVGIQPS